MEISNAGIDFIKQYEGFRSKPYLDSANIPTIGYGTILYPDGTKVTMDDEPIDEPTACEYLKDNVSKKCKAINDLVTVEISQNQFDALASFVYNLGVGAFKGSTLRKYLNDSDFEAAANEFPKWDIAGGRVVPGLLKRREAERDLFLS